MTDKAKLEKIKKLADAMYDAAFNMTTDASLLRKAMDKYNQFIINEYHKEEPVSEELEAARKQLMADIWHKESEHPDNRHPYPVLNPDGEMAFAYYDKFFDWQFDRDFKHSVNMLWLDIEKILPKKD